MKPPLLEGEDLRSQAFLGTEYPRLTTGLTKGQIRHNPLHVGLVDQGRFGELALAFCIFGRHEVAARGMCAQYLSGSSDLEPLGDCFSRLAARDGLRHKARKISTPPRADNRFSVYRPSIPAIIRDRKSTRLNSSH